MPLEAGLPASGDLEFYLQPHQLRFGRVVESGIRHPAMIGGAGLGKTKVLVATAITLCGINIGLPMVVTEPTYGMVVDILEPAIAEACEEEPEIDAQGHIVLDAGRSPVMIPRKRPIPFRYRARNHAFEFPWWGSSILCRSGDKPRRLRGPNLAAAAMDEAGDQEEEVFTTLQGRVRHPQAVLRCVMVLGTPRGFDWMYQRWAEPGGKRRLKDAALIRAKSTDNLLVMAADPGWERSMRETYDPELYKQEVLGEFVSIGQLSYYYGFSREGNLRRGHIDPGKPVIVCCGFNHAPLEWVVGQPAGQGIHCLGEISSATSTDAACDEVIELFGDPHVTEYIVYGDASGFTRTVHKQYSDYEIIRERLNTSPRVNRRNARPRDRANATNALLTNAAGVHRILVDPERCPKLTRDLEQTRTIPGTLDADGSNPDLTHWANALSFWAVMEHPIVAGAR